VNDCYTTPTRCRWRAAARTISPRSSEPKRSVAVLGTMVGARAPARSAFPHREGVSGAHARARRDRPGGRGRRALPRRIRPRRTPRRPPAEAAEWLDSHLEPGDGGPDQGLEVGRDGDDRRGLGGGAQRGGGPPRSWEKILIAGHGLDADLHLPRAEIHRITCGGWREFRPTHPRGRPARSTNAKAGDGRRWAA